MGDTELFREPILRHAQPLITGRFVGFQSSYPRRITVPQPLLLATLAAAAILSPLSALRPRTRSRRTFRELKQGPEFLVTEVRVRDDAGQVFEVEMHGHLPQSALHRGDLLQLTTAAQADPRETVRLVRLINLTTMQPLTPRSPTLWSHLGPGLLIQATLGVVVAAAIIAAWVS